MRSRAPSLLFGPQDDSKGNGFLKIVSIFYFNFDFIFTAYSQALADGFPATDDAMMVERLGGEVHILPGDRRNIKITTPEDLVLACAICGLPEYSRP